MYTHLLLDGVLWLIIYFFEYVWTPKKSPKLFGWVPVQLQLDETSWQSKFLFLQPEKQNCTSSPAELSRTQARYVYKRWAKEISQYGPRFWYWWWMKVKKKKKSDDECLMTLRFWVRMSEFFSCHRIQTLMDPEQWSCKLFYPKRPALGMDEGSKLD